MLQAETNADLVILSPTSSTPDIQIEPVIIYTVPPTVTLSSATEAQIDAIEGDTNELQSNQGNWLTATGFATPTNVSDAQTAIITEIDANEGKIDTAISNIGTLSGKADAIQAKTDNLPADPADDSDIDDQLEAIQADIDTLLSYNLGAGAIEWTYTLTDADTGFPIADADIWVTTDEAGENVIASGRTDQSGVVTFYLDAGTVYVWRQKSGWNFDNPDTEAVS